MNLQQLFGKIERMSLEQRNHKVKFVTPCDILKVFHCSWHQNGNEPIMADAGDVIEENEFYLDTADANHGLTWGELAGKIGALPLSQRAQDVKFIEPYDQFDIWDCELHLWGDKAELVDEDGEKLNYGEHYLQ